MIVQLQPVCRDKQDALTQRDPLTTGGGDPGQEEARQRVRDAGGLRSCACVPCPLRRLTTEANSPPPGNQSLTGCGAKQPRAYLVQPRAVRRGNRLRKGKGESKAVGTRSGREGRRRDVRETHRPNEQKSGCLRWAPACRGGRGAPPASAGDLQGLT